MLIVMIADMRQDAGFRIIAKCSAGKELVRHIDNTAHAGNNFIAVGGILETFPFRHPVGTKGRPIRSAAGVSGILARLHNTPHRVNRYCLKISIRHLAHQVAGAFVGSQIIVKTFECGHADAGLFGGAAPMHHIMPGSQTGKGADMVHVHFAGVARHGLRHAENIGAAGPQKHVPKPHLGHQFVIVPGVAAHIVAPDMAEAVVGMHHVAVMPEAVPVALLDFLLIEVDGCVQFGFQPGFGRRAGPTS